MTDWEWRDPQPITPSQLDPDIQLSAEAVPPAPARRSSRKRLILLGVTVSVITAFGIVAAGAFGRQDAVRSALASVFSSPTLKVVFTAQTSDRGEAAKVSQYSVALTVTSENGSQPLSGFDGVDNFEISVYRSGVDLGDVLVANGGVYGRLNLQAISPSSYRRATASLNSNVAPGLARDLGQAALDDQWVGVEQSLLGTFSKGVVGATVKEPSFATSRNDVALSFSQAWDAWASIHEVSSSNGTTEYSVKIPVRQFVASFVQRLESALAKQVPSMRAELGVEGLLVRAIPASLAIPISLSVNNGVMTQLEVSYKGDSLDLAISHPSLGVSPPAGAVMVTAQDITSLENSYGVCGSASSSARMTPGACSCGSTEGGAACSAGGLNLGGFGLGDLFGGFESCSAVSISSPAGSPSPPVTGVSGGDTSCRQSVAVHSETTVTLRSSPASSASGSG